jgi:hypothetical protein
MTKHHVIAATFTLLVVACHAAMETDRSETRSDVLTMIRERGEAPVMIALIAPAGFGDPAADADQVRAGIARMQAEVLAALDSSDFRDRQRFASIPAMAGTLRSERGLRTLLAHPLVRRVDIDPAGTGHHPAP